MILPTRSEAGRRLADAVARLDSLTPVIVTLTPGGARVANEICQVLDAPLDIMDAAPLSVPGRPRSVFGAVAGGTVLLNDKAVEALGLPDSYVAAAIEHETARARRHSAILRGGSQRLALAGRVTILVDDGCTDPWVVRGAVKALRRARALRVVFAAPTWTRELEAALRVEADECVVLYGASDRRQVQLCDQHFAQTTEREVQGMLVRSRSRSLAPA